MMDKLKKIFFADITSVPEILNKSYFSSLDGLRGVAILIVIFSHIYLYTSLGEYFNGQIGVEVFFVLSGFLITTLLIKERIKNGKVSIKNFYIRRALRILPVAYLFLILILVLNLALKLNVTTIDFIASFFYFKNLPLQWGYGWWYNGHFWTLAVEEQFYLIFPWLLIYNFKIYIKVVCAMIVAIPILQFLGFHNIGIFTNPIVHKLTFAIITLFGKGTTSILIGSLLSILIFNGTLPMGKIKSPYFLTTILFLVAIAFRIVFSESILNSYLISTIFAIAIAVIIFLCLDSNDFLSTILKNKILVKIGILSYSLYIWQQLFTYDQPWKNSFKYSDSLFLNIPALFIVAYLSYTFYEKRFLKLKEKFKQ